MPPRPTWKGYIKVSLVNIPVKVYPATEASATISFNQLHAACQTKIWVVTSLQPWGSNRK